MDAQDTAPERSAPDQADVTPDVTAKAIPGGYLVRKMREGDGITIGDDVEIRLSTSRANRAEIAIRAPQNMPIRRIPKDPPSQP